MTKANIPYKIREEHLPLDTRKEWEKITKKLEEEANALLRQGESSNGDTESPEDLGESSNRDNNGGNKGEDR